MRNIIFALLLAVSVRAADIQVFFSPKGGCTEARVYLSQQLGNFLLVLGAQVLQRTAALLRVCEATAC